LYITVPVFFRERWLSLAITFCAQRWLQKTLTL